MRTISGAEHLGVRSLLVAGLLFTSGCMPPYRFVFPATATNPYDQLAHAMRLEGLEVEGVDAKTLQLRTSFAHFGPPVSPSRRGDVWVRFLARPTATAGGIEVELVAQIDDCVDIPSYSCGPVDSRPGVPTNVIAYRDQLGAKLRARLEKGGTFRPFTPAPRRAAGTNQ
jgi:hypothetical protein